MEAATTTAVPAGAGEKRGRRSGRPGLIRGALRTPRGRVGATLTILVLLIAALGPFFAPHSATEFLAPSYAPPGTDGLLLGADSLGRDVVSRVLDGGRVLLLCAIAATLLGLAIGTLLGMIAAFRGGWIDGLLMRTIDVFLSVPAIVFGLLLVSLVGPKLWLVTLAVALTHAPQVARVIRSATVEICERDFVKSARLTGMPPRRIMVTEILPNLVTPLTVEAGLRLSYSIILIAGLSFLGFGVQPPSPDWGRMVNENRLGLEQNPWAVLAPSILLCLLAVGANTFSDAVARVGAGIDRTEVASADPSLTIETLEKVD